MQVAEPFTKLLTQGMVLNHIYSRRGEKGGIEYFWPHEVEDIRDETGKVTGARVKADGSLVDYEGVGTMSKSKNNGVDPQELIDRYGADTARLFVMFASPPEQTLEWNDAGVEGAHRFLKRVWGFGAKNTDLLQRATAGNFSGATLRPEAAALRREVHLVLRQVSHDFDRMQYNTVVSGCMKLLNALEAFKSDGGDGDTAVLCEGTSVLLRALYPACPHITHALWSSLGFGQAVGDLLDAPWPKVDEAALVQDQITLVLQIGGKTRGSLSVPAAADKAAIETAALASPEFAKFAKARPRRRSSWCPAGWSTWWSDRTHGVPPRCRPSRGPPVEPPTAAGGGPRRRCGWHRQPVGLRLRARQTPPMPFARIALTGFAERSPLAAELRRGLADSVRLVDTPGQADVVLQALLDSASAAWWRRPPPARCVNCSCACCSSSS